MRVIVENKVGANSNISTAYDARSKPGGYALYPFACTTAATTVQLFKHARVDIGKSIQVAAMTRNLAFILLVDAKDHIGLPR